MRDRRASSFCSWAEDFQGGGFQSPDNSGMLTYVKPGETSGDVSTSRIEFSLISSPNLCLKFICKMNLFY